jgi:3-hydroxybutyryl-CoA dehydrogenase
MIGLLGKSDSVGIVGAGVMGLGISQVAASYGHKVLLYDENAEYRDKVVARLEETFNRRVSSRNKLTESEARDILNRFNIIDDFSAFQECGLIIEAVYEDFQIKQKVFSELERNSSKHCLLATNTSSISVSSIAASCKDASRVLGAHFFNPAHVMPLVEIIPGLATSKDAVQAVRTLLNQWGKTTVLANDTPGFIVNRIARPFYGEALRILEEGIADVPTIDWAMTSIGGFKMGPFQLMDFIGNDVNFKVTETVFEAFYYDPRYRPSLIQKRLVESKRYGRKSGQGFYDYSETSTNPEPNKDSKLGKEIFMRIIAMLINEAADAVYYRIASIDDIDLAMIKGVNYPKGLLSWADEIGLDVVLSVLNELSNAYSEDRYRPSQLLKQMVKSGTCFYNKAKC